MKQSFWVVFLLLFFLMIIPFKELVYSLLNKDNNLGDEIVLQSDYQKLRQEYETLLEIHSLKEDSVIVSKVIIHDPHQFYEQITILKGNEDGIEVGDIVYNEVGFIGRVSHTNQHSSIVSLFTYPNTKIAVYINNNYGVLEVKLNQLVIHSIIGNKAIDVGDIAYTSEKSEINKSIPIGKVIDVKQGSVSNTLVVEPIVDLNQLNYVYVGKKVIYE